MKPPMTRDQKSTILGGIFWIVALLAILQLWLLTATMNAWMGGDASVAWPAAGGQCRVPFRQSLAPATPLSPGKAPEMK